MKFSITRVNDVELADVVPSDYPDFVDAYICAARWKHSGAVLIDEEIELLTQANPTYAQDHAYEHMLNYID